LPAFLAIARAIAEAARHGRLVAGTRLPGSRELAATLGVHRNTVMAAYRELLAEGFLSTSAGRGTFVASTLPGVRPRRWLSAPVRAPGLPAWPHFPFEAAPAAPAPSVVPPDVFALYGGLPDTRGIPIAALGRAYRRALRDDRRVLDYGDPRGEERLRSALAQMLRAARALPVTADNIMVTRGSQQALALLGRVLVRPGDVVAVEAAGYKPAWRALAQPGARLAPVPIDAHGLVVDALTQLCEREAVRAVYVTPHHQYPTTVTLSAARRMALLDLARRKRLAIVEDDYDHEFHYEGRPVLPLASGDGSGVVLYVGTLSKVLAPGLRVGYVVAPKAVLDAVVSARIDADRQGDRLGERALADLLEDGELQRHLWRMRRVYHSRRDHFVRELRAHMSPWLSFSVPPGGLALWARVNPVLPVGRWLNESAKRSVLFQPGNLFAWGGRDTPHVRLGFGALTEAEMSVAVARVAEAARAAQRTRRRC
jgi:GntR family transcriptional regulator/MocR family aminotransferase